jgi:hypothetical protein
MTPFFAVWESFSIRALEAAAIGFDGLKRGKNTEAKRIECAITKKITSYTADRSA